MPITVKIPAPLRSLTANQSEVAVENAATVQAALEELSRKYPGIKERLLGNWETMSGVLRRNVVVAPVWRITPSADSKATIPVVAFIDQLEHLLNHACARKSGKSWSYASKDITTMKSPRSSASTIARFAG